MRLPKALRVSRENSLGYHNAQAPIGVYVNGPPGAPRDIPDAMRGSRSIDHSTVASTVAGIAAAAGNSNRRRG